MKLRVMIVPALSFLLALSGAFVGYKLARSDAGGSGTTRREPASQPLVPAPMPTATVPLTPPNREVARPARSPAPYHYNIEIELTPLFEGGVRQPTVSVGFVNPDGVAVQEPAFVLKTGKSELNYTGHAIAVRLVGRNYSEAKMTLFRDGREVARDTKSGDFVILSVSDR